MILKTCAIGLVVLILYCITGYVGANVPVLRQLALLDHLLTVASVVIAIIGIWLAVVYPEIITSIFRTSNTQEKEKHFRKAKALLVPFGIAVIVACAIILIRVIIEILITYQIPVAQKVKRGFLFGFIGISSLSLVLALFLAAFPGFYLLYSALSSIRKSSRRDKFSSSAQKVDRKNL